MSLEPRLRKDAVFETFVEMVCLVVGGTMSLSAARRSMKDSSTDASDSIEDKDAELDVRDEEVDA